MLFNWLSDINPQIYAYLFSNLSSFILYVQSNKKFYLRRGKNFMFDSMYINILEVVTKNYKHFS